MLVLQFCSREDQQVQVGLPLLRYASLLQINKMVDVHEEAKIEQQESNVIGRVFALKSYGHK